MALPSSPKRLSSARRSRLPYKKSKFVEQNASSSHLNQWTAVDEKLTQTNGHDDSHGSNKWWRKATRSWERQFWWPTEILHFIISTALVIGIVVLLLQYDGTALSDWPYNITINTLASVMIALAAVFMVTPLNSCIAQQRWNRFVKRRRLYDFHLVSQAKTPIGALRLLLTFQGGPLALFGAAMVILNFSVGPFVQQLIHTELGSEVQLGFPSMPIVRKYGGPDATDKSLESGVGFSMRNAFFQGFYSPAATFHVMPTCPSGSHCEWDSYMTLKFCSSCMDMTSNVTTTSDNPGASEDGMGTSWSMPGGVTLDDSGSNATKFIATTMIRQPDFPFDLTSPTTVLTLAVMGQSRNTDNSIKAAACRVAYCTQQYTGNFSNGGLIELPRSAPRLEFDDGGNQFGDYGNYAVYGNASNSIQNMFHRLMELKVQSNADSSVSSDDDYSSGYVVRSSLDLPEHGRILQNAFLNPNASNRSGNLTGLMENIAASLSTALRMTTKAKEQVGGVAIDSRVLIRVQWAWIALPAAFYLFTFVLLILNILQTRIAKFGMWKDNELALLFHGLEPGIQRQDEDLHYVDEMETAARDMKVKLTRLHNTWYLAEDAPATKVYNYPAPRHHSDPVEPDHAEQDIEHEPSLQADYEDSRPLSTTGSLPQLNTHVAGSMEDFEPRDRHSPVSPE